MKTAAKKYLKTIGFSILAWELAFAFLMFLRTYGIEPPSDSFGGAIAHWIGMLVSGMFFGLVGGVLFGALDILLDAKALRRKSYGFIIVLRSLFIITIMVVLLFAVIIFWLLLLPDDPAGRPIREIFKDVLFSDVSVVLIVYLSVVSVLFSLIKQMNNKFGPGILYKMLMGKYYRPQEEDRIFMFLDLKSSTTYAERLGHVKYSRLIQDCFDDLTDSITKHKVEIYQYVGDEAVLTWLVDDGLENTNCLQTYFDFMQMLSERADYYNRQYGFVPEFKAGVNIGAVMVAEVGVVKREIAYHSDVLNTAARIQGKCNEFGKWLLISEYLARRFEQETAFAIERVGKVLLRGKEQEIDIFAVEKKETLDGSVALRF